MLLALTLADTTGVEKAGLLMHNKLERTGNQAVVT
jgi:hypothetical protein